MCNSDTPRGVFRHAGTTRSGSSSTSSTSGYLDLYPDVATKGMNPLLHYVQFGHTEGRVPARRDYTVWIEQYVQHIGLSRFVPGRGDQGYEPAAALCAIRTHRGACSGTQGLHGLDRAVRPAHRVISICTRTWRPRV